MQRLLEQQVNASLAPFSHAVEGEAERSLGSQQSTLQSAREVLECEAAKKASSRAKRHGRKMRLGACLVCCEEEVSTVFYRCGHMCACAGCAHNLKQRRAQCPVCRAPIRDVVQAFLAGHDWDDEEPSTED